MYKQHHFHFVGINGIGMSGIAKILYKQGHTISGCDLAQETKNIQELIDAGCAISHEHNASICNDSSITTVVYSSDIAHDNTELIQARAKGITIIQRAALLAEIMRTKCAIGVAGSHGKTTTTSMIGHILHQAKIDPTIIVGGIMHNINNNAYYGQGDYIVAETDESDRSHLLLPVTIAVLTNVDFEHANIYKNLDEVKTTFTQFINQLPLHGKAIICLDDTNIQTMITQFSASYSTYGTHKNATMQAINIQLYPDYSTFDVIDNEHQKMLGSVTLHMPSIYNVLNATGAIAAAQALNIPFDTIAKALADFHGVERRFTFKGIMKHPAAEIFDDYGHHPTEIYHSLITARRKAKNKVIVVFQPQRYTRTYHLWDAFIEVFKTAAIDHLIITDIWPANEAPINTITGERLVSEIIVRNPRAQVQYIPFKKGMDEIKHTVLSLTNTDDLILLLGAGKINGLAELLL